MSKLCTISPVLVTVLVFGLWPAPGAAADLSAYRDFQFGMDLQTVEKQTGATSSQMKTVHSRPALIQELEWHPQPLGWASKAETVQMVTFSFYNGELFRIVINYNRSETEGMTTGDLVDAISANYGKAENVPALTVVDGPYGEKGAVLARWEDPQYRFDLVRLSYGPSFKLIGVVKKLEAPVQAATLAASRLDDQEAPLREAARLAAEEGTAKAKLEKARLVNKPKFRP
jgi:hypothetical protein